MSILIKVFPYGPLHENTYFVTDENSGLSAIIDPGYYGSEIVDLIVDNNTLKYIFLTHGHFDHLYAAQDYLDNYSSAKLVAPLADTYLIHKDWENDYLTRGMAMRNCPEPHIYIKDGDSLMLGDSEFKFISTPGHTEGGVCILCGDKLFSGDTLFRLSVGNTSLETGDWSSLQSSIRNKLYILDDSVVVLPGHGASTTIGYEKRSNPFV